MILTKKNDIITTNDEDAILGLDKINPNWLSYDLTGINVEGLFTWEEFDILYKATKEIQKFAEKCK